MLFAIPRLRGLVMRAQSLVFARCHRRVGAAGARVFGWPIVSFAPGSRVSLGRDLRLISDSRFSEPGVNHPVVLRTVAPGAVLVIGDHVGMSGCTVCAARSVIIGCRCLLGADVFIADTDFHAVDPAARLRRERAGAGAPARIGDNVFVGARAMILKGVTTIGDDAVIGAGSVVTSDIPAGAVAAGVPARVVRRTGSIGAAHVG
jgi:acetyltransferase-like isoleucine patch superfamily enzyme